MQSNIVEEIVHYCNVSVKSYTEMTDLLINFYDFTFVLNGSMVYYANGQKIVLEKDDAIFLPPGNVRKRE